MQTHTFHDFDAFAGSVRDVDSVMMIQNPKHRSWSISHIDLPEIHVQYGRLGSGNVAEGQSWPGGYLLYLPLTDACVYSATGTVLDRFSFAVLEPGCDFCLSSKDEHDWCTVFVPVDKFARGGDPGEPSSGSGKKMMCRVTRANRQLADQFWASARDILTAAANYSQFESTPAATCAAEELVKIASLVVGEPIVGEPHQEGRPKVSRAEIIRRSKELMQERDGERVLVGELAAAAEVSERTLRTAFCDYFGTGPVRYLQLRQLHQVHRALRAADPEAESVTDVLVRYGEWEFSRFASRYRRLFGERPSQTLRTKGK